MARPHWSNPGHPPLWRATIRGDSTYVEVLVAGGAAELANELKMLRKGRGLQTPKLSDQVGPMLRQLCGITGTESAATLREKLSERLRNLADALPDDLRLAVTVALAIHQDTQQQFLQDRV